MNKISRLFAAVIIICSVNISPTFAEVFFEKTGGGAASSVYVAGNPTLYPIEYYDTETKTYKGIIPDMLEEVSEKTGIDFTYIMSGKDNMQKSLYKNKQVEMITAIPSDSGRFEDMEKLTVIAVESEGKTVKYCIGFSDILPHKTKETIINALNEVSEQQKNGFIIKNAKMDLRSAQKRFVTVLSLLLALAVTAAGISIYIIRKRRNLKKINRMIDENTGIGNAEYYTYAYDTLISEQAKSLYNLAYIAFDTASFEEQKNAESVKNIEKYAASKLIHYISASEYAACLDKGTFVLLFQAENEQAAEERISEITSGINRYISEFVKNCDNLFKTGYCRLDGNAEATYYIARQGYLYAQENDILCHAASKKLADENKKAETLAAQIDNALENDEFKIYMQLITCGKTGKFCGAEVLSRWQNSEYGLLRPSEYIHVLNKTGKIAEHDYVVFENACRQLAAWNKQPFDKLFLTCNFTRLSFSKADFTEKLTEITSKYSLKPERLVIEITEDTLSVSSETVSENIKRLSALGFKVAIDDMGAGFSSLADIYDNEIDIVKIEKDFVSSCSNERRHRMLSDIISLIHNAGARVICEGIETSEQAEMLKHIDCDMMQGFYFSRVLPVSECEKLIGK